MTTTNPMTALVTGAAGTIGGWIADALLEAGYHVFAIDDRPLAGPLAQRENLSYLPCDLSDPSACDRLMDEIENRGSVIHLLVNSAGIFPSGPLVSTSASDFDRIMAINVRAPFVLMQRMARLLIQNGQRGSIVNISSSASRRLKSTFVPYCTSKAALAMLTDGFALEMARHGIRVNAIEPGFVSGSSVSVVDPTYRQSTVQNIPTGRESGSHDIVAAVSYLASEAAGNVTGTTLVVDGGGSLGIQVVENGGAPS